MNLQNLKELREIFRKRFKEEDFCIGEEQVEKLFRELLNEPEPVSINHVTTLNPIVAKILENKLKEIAPKLKESFERDDVFFAKMKKR